MKTPVIAALLLIASAGVATADVGPANSTNQHLRDSADFYDNVPDFGMFSNDRAANVSLEREVEDRTQPRSITR